MLGLLNSLAGEAPLFPRLELATLQVELVQELHHPICHVRGQLCRSEFDLQRYDSAFLADVSRYLVLEIAGTFAEPFQRCVSAYLQ